MMSISPEGELEEEAINVVTGLPVPTPTPIEIDLEDNEVPEEGEGGFLTEEYLPLPKLKLPLPSPSSESSHSTSNKSRSAAGRETSWRKASIEAALRDISRAEFVAIDLEFTGLFRTGLRQHTLEKYFQECSESAENFLAVQLGICPTWRDPTSSGNVWQMSPYNFNVFPRERRIFTSDSSTLSWLLENGFSFDHWVRNGFDYARLASLQRAEQAGRRRGASIWRDNIEKVKEEGLQLIISHLIEKEKPVVVHNGLFDMLHIYHKFVDALPSSLEAFCQEWLRLFSGGIFDTKHIATEGRITVLGIQSERGTALNELYTHLHRNAKCQTHMMLSPEAASMAPASDANNDGTAASVAYALAPGGSAKSRCHEAGYDAMITAQVFLMEAELYHKLVPPPKPTAQNGRDQCLHIPLDWCSDSCFGARFRNVIELVKVTPGKIQLEAKAASLQQQQLLAAAALLAAAPPSSQPGSHQMLVESEGETVSAVSGISSLPRKRRRTGEGAIEGASRDSNQDGKFEGKRKGEVGELTNSDENTANNNDVAVADSSSPSSSSSSESDGGSISSGEPSDHSDAGEGGAGAKEQEGESSNSIKKGWRATQSTGLAAAVRRRMAARGAYSTRGNLTSRFYSTSDEAHQSSSSSATPTLRYSASAPPPPAAVSAPFFYYSRTPSRHHNSRPLRASGRGGHIHRNLKLTNVPNTSSARQQNHTQSDSSTVGGGAGGSSASPVSYTIDGEGLRPPHPPVARSLPSGTWAAPLRALIPSVANNTNQQQST